MSGFVPASAEARILLGSWLAGFKPEPKMRASEWIEANIRLNESNNARPGPLRLFKYQRDMIDAIAEPGIRVAALQLGAQIGKSLSLDALTMYLAVNDPGPMLYVTVDNDMAKDWVRSRINPMVDASPNLKGLWISKGRGRAGDSLAVKQFAGGSIHTGSSESPEDLAARSIRYVMLDETDRFRLSAGQEGDVPDLALTRTFNYEDSLGILASTPTDHTTRINPWFKRGDQRRFFVPCPECRKFEYYRGSQLTFKPGKFDTARLICLHCKHYISEAERRSVLPLGEWRPTATPADPRHISFHAPQLISEAPKSSLFEIAQRSEAAKLSEEKKKTFVNTVLAEVYVSEGFNVEPETLQSRAVRIRAPYPSAILYVTAAADVQGNRIEVQFQGHAAENVVYVLDHVVLMGDTTSSAVWKSLAEQLDRRFELDDGHIATVDVSCVDSGNNAVMVYGRVAELRQGSRRVHPSKGVQRLTGGINIKSTSTTANGLTLFSIGTDVMKTRVMHGVAMEYDGPYRIYLPDHLDGEFFAGVASEKLVRRYVKGFPVDEFVKTRSRNEPLDCLAYGIAIGETLSRERRKGRGRKVVQFPKLNETLNRGA